MNKILKFSGTLFIATVLLAASGYSQSTAALTIGDAAPEIKYARWLKGTPVQRFENDKLYVLEFWATWCGPCQAAMPHLTELAKKYEGKAVFMGVNIWEKTGDQPYESSLPNVSRFVSSVGDKMGYNVLADNNERHMANKWMAAAGQRGIPSTFLVQKGNIIWIGSPAKLDSVMQVVLDGKYDMASFKRQLAERQARSEATMSKFKVLEPIYKAQESKEYDKALVLIETEMAKKEPILNSLLGNMKLSVLLDQQKEDKALAFAEEWLKSNKNAGSSIARTLLEKEGLSKQVYLYALDLYKPLLTSQGVVVPMVQQIIAKGYAKIGDYKNAVAYQEKAVVSAKEALKEGRYPGIILDYTVTDFEQQLKSYQNKL